MPTRLTAILLCGFLLILNACGGDSLLELSPAATQGRQIANSSGCAACHGKNGQGVTAPSWKGIYGQQIELQDGTTVIADDEYLARSITDPAAELVKDFTIKMPQNALTDADIELVLTYIRELQ